LAGLVHDPLTKSSFLSDDAKRRIEWYKSNKETPVGAYTSNSKGYTHIRQKVAEFISQRDGGIKTDPERIYLTNGASEGVRTAFTAIIRNSHDGILVPIP
jgi:aspartate/methionine/tyrosine aminotransferase